jgi:2-succinyl-6-hydroxy-2,4-cyclohexadiene-1-carboxylate synthase
VTQKVKYTEPMSSGTLGSVGPAKGTGPTLLQVTTEADPLLASERCGAGDRLVLLHGFTQNRRCWGEFAKDLAADHELLLIDAPGHGGSGMVEADLDQSALLSGQIGGSATYVGYSMGGRTALHLALTKPDLVKALVLIGATGGLDAEVERSERRRADEALAMRIESIGVSAFIEEWLDQPLFSSLSERTAFREERCTNTAVGLARSLRLCGTGTQRPLWADLGELQMPVLVLAGEQDAKFIALGRRLATSIGSNAIFEIVPACGHSTQLENPQATASLMRAWQRSRLGS